eukprot:scaffold30593_cov118-Isochrysis_galbana.AAC.6
MWQDLNTFPLQGEGSWSAQAGDRTPDGIRAGEDGNSLADGAGDGNSAGAAAAGGGGGAAAAAEARGFGARGAPGALAPPPLPCPPGAPLPWRQLPSAAFSAPLSICVVNEQPRALFVYSALEMPAGGEVPQGGGAPGAGLEIPGGGDAPGPLLPLSPWPEPLPPAELPVALSAASAHRGTYCLLLSPWEGLPCCTADGAEIAPFGQSNTFRFNAGTGRPAALAGAAALRIELAVAGDGDEPGQPFCVLRVPVLAGAGVCD